MYMSINIKERTKLTGITSFAVCGMYYYPSISVLFKSLKTKKQMVPQAIDLIKIWSVKLATSGIESIPPITEEK